MLSIRAMILKKHLHVFFPRKSALVRVRVTSVVGNRAMRDASLFSIKRALPRMSWTPKNLFNLYMRTAGPKQREITFRNSSRTLFQQRWRSKAVVRAYHGDHINEKIFKRWYLPETLPDVRPRRKVLGDDKASLAEFSLRKQKEKDLAEEEQKKGMAPVGSLMFAEVERRLDVFIFRACFAQSVYEARRLVVHGDVLLNGKKHQNANTRLAPGDMVSVNPDAIRFLKKPANSDSWQNISGYDEELAEKYNKAVIEADEQPAKGITTPISLPPRPSTTRFYLPHYASPWLFIPAYIEPSFATCSAVYVRHPTARPGYSEIPTPYDADGEIIRFAWEWYVQRRPRMRSKSQLARMPEDRALAQTEDINEGRKKLRRDIARIKARRRV